MKTKISFEEANQLVNIREQSAKEIITSRGLQLSIIALFCVFIALLPLKNSIVITSILIIIIVISYIYYFILKSNNKLLEDFGWQLAKYNNAPDYYCELNFGNKSRWWKTFWRFLYDSSTVLSCVDCGI
ncbi:hypothetical protein ACPDKE_002184 [Listeria monocytogenes]